MAKNFYIADTHFGHKNILKYDNRPFFTTEEMDNELVERWSGGTRRLIRLIRYTSWGTSAGKAKRCGSTF